MRGRASAASRYHKFCVEVKPEGLILPRHNKAACRPVLRRKRPTFMIMGPNPFGSGDFSRSHQVSAETMKFKALYSQFIGTISYGLKINAIFRHFHINLFIKAAKFEASKNYTLHILNKKK